RPGELPLPPGWRRTPALIENLRSERKENSMKARTGRVSVLLGLGLLGLSAAVATAQQPSTTKTTQPGQPHASTSSRTVNAPVGSVNGNKVVAQDASGKATEYTIPDGFKFQFEEKEIGVGELNPG